MASVAHTKFYSSLKNKNNAPFPSMMLVCGDPQMAPELMQKKVNTHTHTFLPFAFGCPHHHRAQHALFQHSYISTGVRGRDKGLRNY